MPLQIALSVQMHHLYRSRFLIETLSAMGLSSSYQEVLRFEKNAADVMASNILGTDLCKNESMLLFAADNVDHNIITIDGKGTFHGMGMIATLTLGKFKERTIQKKKNFDIEVVETAKIEIIDYHYSKHAMSSISFKRLQDSSLRSQPLDIVWHSLSNVLYHVGRE